MILVEKKFRESELKLALYVHTGPFGTVSQIYVDKDDVKNIFIDKLINIDNEPSPNTSQYKEINIYNYEIENPENEGEILFLGKCFKKHHSNYYINFELPKLD